MGKLAMWRLNTHEAYGGTWLSDFVPNYLGGYLEAQAAEPEKPDCPPDRAGRKRLLTWSALRPGRYAESGCRIRQRK